MECAEEVAALKRAVGPLVGGEGNLAFDFLRGKMTVLVPTDEPTREGVRAAVAVTGMEAIPWSDEASRDPESLWRRRGQALMAGTSGTLTLAGIAAHWAAHGSLLEAVTESGGGDGHAFPAASIGFFVGAIVSGAWFIAPRALSAAKRLRPDMNLLMTIAVLAAAAIGEWFEAATVCFLFALALWLEIWSVGRARRAVEALVTLAPLTARVVRSEGTEEEVRAEEVAVGARFVVRPGEKIPLDGTVLRGTTEVDQAPITGESVPLPKKPSDPVFAGTINGDGAIEVECTRAAGNTTLARIIRLVEEAQSKRSPSEQWVERFARVYTPSVMVLAALVLLVPPLLFGAAWTEWTYRALVLLVIACPCALVISTPVSIVAALASAARNGVLIKGGLHLEMSARLSVVALDKTGTLTEGKPAVVDVVPLSGHDERELLEAAAAIEARSAHPVAEAIVWFVRARGIPVCPAEEFQAIQGKGAKAKVQGREYWLGSHRYLEERGQETTGVHRTLEGLTRAGRTVVVVGTDSHVCGLIALADTVRPASPAALSDLRRLGVERLVMLTGDNQGTADAVADQVGVDESRAELLPEDKVAAVEDLVKRYGLVAMVGDGVNDAPALARASVGIAMGAAGSDAAIETADIALMSDDISKLPWLVRHSRRTLAIIRENIALSLAVKAAFVLLTFLGHATLWGAIAADMGASLVVIFNGLRLLRDRRCFM